jgi:hypothetical protein
MTSSDPSLVVNTLRGCLAKIRLIVCLDDFDLAVDKDTISSPSFILHIPSLSYNSIDLSNLPISPLTPKPYFLPFPSIDHLK